MPPEFFDQLEIRPLCTEDVDRAFTLVSVAKSWIDLEQWRRFARPSIDLSAHAEPGAPAYGVVVAATAGNTLIGLYTWSVCPSLDYGTIFRVENFIAAGVVQPHRILHQLIDYIMAQASESGCGAVHADLPASYTVATTTAANDPMISAFVNAGFNVEKVKLCRPLDGSICHAVEAADRRAAKVVSLTGTR